MNKNLKIFFPNFSAISKGYHFNKCIILNENLNFVEFYGKNFSYDENNLINSTIKVVRNNLTQKEYYKTLINFDIFVMLYKKEDFCFRTSGVLLDVLYKHKNCIVLEDTELANFVTKYQIGYVCKNNLNDIINKIFLVIENYQSLLKNRNAYIKMHQELHSFDQLFELFKIN